MEKRKERLQAIMMRILACFSAQRKEVGWFIHVDRYQRHSRWVQYERSQRCDHWRIVITSLVGEGHGHVVKTEREQVIWFDSTSIKGIDQCTGNNGRVGSGPGK